jgi:hypothetical protein
MKKIIILLLLCMNFITIDANSQTPTYKIIANSNSEHDIQEMYKTKDQLLDDYQSWVKGVDDVYQVLADHTSYYGAEYYNGQYTITLGEGKGKQITGKLQVSYCTSGRDIQKKSLFANLFS